MTIYAHSIISWDLPSPFLVVYFSLRFIKSNAQSASFRCHIVGLITCPVSKRSYFYYCFVRFYFELVQSYFWPFVILYMKSLWSCHTYSKEPEIVLLTLERWPKYIPSPLYWRPVFSLVGLERSERRQLKLSSTLVRLWSWRLDLWKLRYSFAAHFRIP